MQVHVNAKHKVVAVQDIPQLTGLFPNAPRFRLAGTDFAALPHGPAETRLLRNLGYDCPAPILSQYDWCGGTPFDVQKKTAALLTTHERAYVLNGMGTGKTKTAIWAFDYLRSRGLAKRAIIVAPLSTLTFTWAKEVFATAPHLSCVVLHGDRARRLKRLSEAHDIYIVNPDGVQVILDDLNGRADIDTLIIDELALFRNGKAKRTKMMITLASRFKWLWGMTGSPTPNSPTDAWALARIVTPATVPKFLTAFRDSVMLRLTQFKWAPRKEAAEVVRAALTPAVRYTLDDVVELPMLVERTMDVALGKRQKDVYDQMRKTAVALVQQHQITAVNAAAVANKLLQVSLGYVYAATPGKPGKETVVLDNDDRLQAVADIVTSCESKVLVFVPFTHALNGVAKRLTDEGFDVATVDGSTSQKDRSAVFTRFQQTDQLKVIVAHPGTMAHGVTLTAADTIVWFGPITSYEIFEQANARIRRIGQRKRQQIIMLQSTAAERKAYAMLRSKRDVQGSILELFEE